MDCRFNDLINMSITRCERPMVKIAEKFQDSIVQVLHLLNILVILPVPRVAFILVDSHCCFQSLLLVNVFFPYPILNQELAFVLPRLLHTYALNTLLQHAAKPLTSLIDLVLFRTLHDDTDLCELFQNLATTMTPASLCFTCTWTYSFGLSPAASPRVPADISFALNLA